MSNRISIFTVASPLLWIAFILMLVPTTQIIMNAHTILAEWVLFPLAPTPMNLTLIMDPIGMLFSCTVLLISANVLSFSTIYMKEDKFTNRFTVLVLLFILSMNLLIFLPHFMILLLGWDGLGIVSFILVIYYQNPKSLAAGMITALTNRIGDVVLLLAIAWTMNQGHWLITNMWNSPMSTAQITCIALAAMTKSAQMPFSSWLPAAMAAPTPVSALVHSSTLVTAGVFLLIRFYPFLHSCNHFNTLMLMIAVTTMLMAGLSATTECDMKKIIALSTLSQLGMMMTSIGFNIPMMAYFHMITHALFKALLFICAGAFINQHLHSQDLRWMGNLIHQMPVATTCITIANLALCGFPFMAGFYSKDMIIEYAMCTPVSMLMFILVLVSLGLTSFYSMRFSVVVMWGPQSSPSMIQINEHKAITNPIMVLTSMSICAGSAMSWIQPLPQCIFILPVCMKLTPITLVSVGALLGWWLSANLTMKSAQMIQMPLFHHASCMMWFLVPLSSQMMLTHPLKVAHNYLKYVDHGWLELPFGNGLHSKLIHYSNSIATILPKSPTAYLLTSITMTALILTMFTLT